MSNKQTAIDYLVEKLNQCEPFYSGIVSLAYKQHIDGLIAQAKTMEKEQIIETSKNSYISGYLDNQCKVDESMNFPEEYYNETFNK